MKRLEVYQAPHGKRPFYEWLNEIKGNATRARIQIRLERVEQGNLGDAKSVGAGVVELRLAQRYWKEYLQRTRHGKT